MEVYKVVRKYIEENGIKQGVIARKIGVSQPIMSAMLTGKRKMYVDDFRAICEALHVSPETFLLPPC